MPPLGLPRKGVVQDNNKPDNSCFINAPLVAINCGLGEAAVSAHFAPLLEVNVLARNAQLDDTTRATGRALLSLFNTWRGLTPGEVNHISLIAACRALNDAARHDYAAFADFAHDGGAAQTQEDTVNFIEGISENLFPSIFGVRQEEVYVCVNVGCNAEGYGERQDPVYTLHLKPPENAVEDEAVLLTALIDKYVQDKSVLDKPMDRTCSKCQGHMFSKNFSTFVPLEGFYEQPPPFVWLFIARFRQVGPAQNVKSQIPVVLPASKVFTLPFRTSPAADAVAVGVPPVDIQHIEYEIVATVEHGGRSLTSGHFTAYAKDPKDPKADVWFHYNDTAVQPSSWADLNTARPIPVSPSDPIPRGGRPYVVLAKRRNASSS